MTVIISLVVIGIILVIAELILPGGVLGIIGGICLFVAVILSFKIGPIFGGSMFIGICIFVLVMIGFWMKHFRSLPVSKSLVLNEAIDDQSELDSLNSLVGQQGIAVTDIAPSGHAEIKGEKFDVMTEAGVINKSASIQVVEVRGPSIFVAEV